MCALAKLPALVRQMSEAARPCTLTCPQFTACPCDCSSSTRQQGSIVARWPPTAMAAACCSGALTLLRPHSARSWWTTLPTMRSHSVRCVCVCVCELVYVRAQHAHDGPCTCACTGCASALMPESMLIGACNMGVEDAGSRRQPEPEHSRHGPIIATIFASPSPTECKPSWLLPSDTPLVRPKSLWSVFLSCNRAPSAPKVHPPLCAQ